MTPNDPTPEQIAEACREIRSRWSDAERRKRAAWAVSRPVVAEVVDDEEVVTGT